jgi:hypothetical protein
MKIIEDIPEIIIIVLAFVSMLLCLRNWIKVKEYASIGYFIGSLYVFILYVIILAFNPPDILRRFWARLGYIIILSNIIIWRITFYTRQRRKS